MDGFEANDGIIVMAATNMHESLDAALTRPGRFDRHVAVPLPDVRGRLEIIDYYLKVAHFFHCRCPLLGMATGLSQRWYRYSKPPVQEHFLNGPKVAEFAPLA